MKTFLRILVVSLGVSATSAYAEGFGVNVGGGTTGLVVDIVQKLSPNFDVRVGMQGLGYKISYEYDNVDYDINQTMAIPEVLLDWRPMAGRFRISVGAAYYNNVGKLKAAPDPNTFYTIGNNTYLGSAIGNISGKSSFHTGAPYLGVGWDFFFGSKQDIGLALNVGAFYRDRADVTLNSTQEGVTPGLSSDLAVEAENIRGDLPKFHPAINVGAAFRF